MTSSSPLFLGIDLGTSGCRGILVDVHDNIVAEARYPFASQADKHGHHEQDAMLWWSAILNVLQQLEQQADISRIDSLAVDGTSGTVLLCDETGAPLHPALMYNDARASEEAGQIAALNIDNSAVLSPTSGLAKLLWLQKQPYSQKASYFLHQADWITGKLLKRFGDSDVNNALKSGFDPTRQQWPAWLQQLHINRNWLPRVHLPGVQLGKIHPDMARQLGLNPQLSIVAGTTDSTAAVIATGIKQTGEAVTSLGSTLVTKVISEQPVSDPASGVYSQPFADKWLVGGASSSGGTVLKQFFTSQQMQQLTKRLQPANPTWLDYYPLPAKGERFPVNDPEKMPVLTPRPVDDAEFFQGMLEGIARIEQQAYEKLAELGAPYPTHVVTCGGGAGNIAWNQIRENLLGIPVTPATKNEAAYGMALLAKHNWEKEKQ